MLILIITSYSYLTLIIIITTIIIILLLFTIITFWMTENLNWNLFHFKLYIYN